MAVFDSNSCINPIPIRRDGRTVFVPCGKCPCCLHRRQQTLAFRLVEEMHSTNLPSYFIGLSYEDEHLPVRELDCFTVNAEMPSASEDFVQSFVPGRYPVLSRKHLADFLGRFRKHTVRRFARQQDLSVSDCAGLFRYCAVGEYGSDTLRPHYHVIVFGYPCADVTEIVRVLRRIWPYGFVTASDLNETRCGYCALYILESAHLPPQYRLPSTKPFYHCSNGIGKDFLTPAMSRYIKANTLTRVIDRNGYSVPLPDYYKNILYPPRSIDRVLRNVDVRREYFRRSCEKQDGLVARYGEDDFGRVLQEYSSLQLEQIRNKMIKHHGSI